MIYTFFDRNYGVALLIGGGVIGGLASWHRIGLSRLLALLVVAVTAKAAPFLGDSALESTTPSTACPANERLTRWLSAGWSCHAGPRNGWTVLRGVIWGVIGGSSLAYLDWKLAEKAGAGYLLPIPHARSQLPGQAVYLATMIASLFAAFSSLVASSAFRRPTLMAFCVGGLFGGIIAASSDIPWGHKLGITCDAAIFAVSATISILLLFSWTEVEGDGEGVRGHETRPLSDNEDSTVE